MPVMGGGQIFVSLPPLFPLGKDFILEIASWENFGPPLKNEG